MNVEELIKKYEAAKKTKKEYDFSKHLKMSYMPYGEKCSLVKNVVENTSYVEVAGKKVYKRNTASMLFVFTMQLISRYTDIDIDGEKVVADYDALMESGVMNLLMSQIPEEEVSILRGMLDMQRDDEEMNTRSLISFFETKADVAKMFFDSLGKVLDKPEIQAKIAEMTK